MSNESINRQPSGVPTGGQFATTAHQEADVALVDDKVLDAVTEQYLVTALWSSTDDDGEPLDSDFGVVDFAPVALAQARTDVSDFLAYNADLIAQAKSLQPDYDDTNVAHDFWLTRNRHGAGFWDRGLGAVGDELTANAHAHGSVDLYVGDDGKVYIQ